MSSKENQCKQTQPAVETVQVGDLVLIVETEHGNCTHDSTHKSKRMQRKMDALLDTTTNQQPRLPYREQQETPLSFPHTYLVGVMAERQRDVRQCSLRGAKHEPERHEQRVPVEHTAIRVRPRKPGEILHRDFAAVVHVLGESRAHPVADEHEDDKRQALQIG